MNTKYNNFGKLFNKILNFSANFFLAYIFITWINTLFDFKNILTILAILIGGSLVLSIFFFVLGRKK